MALALSRNHRRALPPLAPSLSRVLLLVLAVLFVRTDPALATQHLLSPGQDIERLRDVVQPGDEIILMPGEHGPLRLVDWRGEPEAPITIRGVTPDAPGTIKPTEVAVQLIGVRHIVLQDLIIERPTRRAIDLRQGVMPLEAAQNEALQHDPPDTTSRSPAHVQMRRIRIIRPGDERDDIAVRLDGISEVRLESITVERSAGPIADLQNVEGITFDQCAFTGRSQPKPALGIEIRGGSDRVTFDRCRFVQVAHSGGIALGSPGETSRSTSAATRSSASDARGPIHLAQRFRPEASRVTVRDSFFIDQACPVIFAQAERCAVRQCTIIRPQRFVFAVLDLTARGRPTTAIPAETPPLAMDPAIGQNLVVWNPGELTGIVLVDRRNASVNLLLEDNLWWSEEPAAHRKRLLPQIGRRIAEQTIDVDPELDEQFHPQNEAAAQFGAEVP